MAIYSCSISNGDISTCVELRRPDTGRTADAKGHLHLRGAQGGVFFYLPLCRGTSPLAWSSAVLTVVGVDFDGDISTCVELRVAVRRRAPARVGHLHLRGAQVMLPAMMIRL